eukprot:7279150-Ditylum_brightwellii.AAC.1
MARKSTRDGSLGSKGTDFTLAISTESTISPNELRELLEGIRHLHDLDLDRRTETAVSASAMPKPSSSSAGKASGTNKKALTQPTITLTW